jgi:3-hydroxyisobutyrate dehydrogenase-like beta-hydroxyacid dehydrogenase
LQRHSGERNVIRTVGMVGVGIMGSRMCANLVKAGFEVTAYDPHEAARAAAAAAGAALAVDLGTLARRVEAVVSSLPDAPQLGGVAEALLPALGPGALWCDTSTVDPATAQRVSEAARAKGIAFLDCPVSGGPAGAEAGTLTVMVGGEATSLEAARPVLEAIGKKIVHCGGAGSGQGAKLVNQALVAAHTVAALEALLVGRKCGLDLDTLVSILKASSGRSWILENHLDRYALAGQFEPGFALELMFKDLRLFVETAVQARAPAPFAASALQLYNAARAAGHGAKDQTVVAKVLEQMAGATLGTLSPTGGA